MYTVFNFINWLTIGPYHDSMKTKDNVVEALNICLARLSFFNIKMEPSTAERKTMHKGCVGCGMA